MRIPDHKLVQALLEALGEPLISTTLLLPGQPKPAAIFSAIEQYKPTVFFGLPTLYTSLTKAEGANKVEIVPATTKR